MHFSEASLGGQQLVESWRAILLGAESFRPAKLHGIDMERLLSRWSEFSAGSGSQSALSKLSLEESRMPYNGSWLMSDSQDRSHVLQKMLEDVRLPSPRFKIKNYNESFTKMVSSMYRRYKEYHPASKQRVPSGIVRGRLEAVGLMPKDPSTGAESMMALGIFARQKLTDDSSGSLLKIVETQFGIKATRGIFGRAKKRISVFSIEGLAEGPFSSARSARVLLGKIAEWALQEHKLIVVPKHAVYCSDGTDLTSYYMRLGFKKVEMDDGTYELIYSYPSTPDVSEESQLMVGWPWSARGQLLAPHEIGLQMFAITSLPQEAQEHSQLTAGLSPWSERSKDRRGLEWMGLP